MSKQNFEASLAELAKWKLPGVTESGVLIPEGGYPYESGGGGINLGYGISVGYPDANTPFGAGMGPGEQGNSGGVDPGGANNGGGGAPAPGGLDWTEWDAKVQAAYQTHLGRQASAGELESHHGNPGGLTAVLDLIASSPEAKEYTKTKNTTPTPTATDVVKQAVLDAFAKKGMKPRDDADLNYWIGKIKGSGGFEDAQNKAYWLDRMSMQYGGVGDYTESGKVGNPGNYRIEPGYGADEETPAGTSPTTPTNTPVSVPRATYTPRNYGAAPVFAPVSFGNALTQYGAQVSGMTPEAYRKLVEAQQQQAAPAQPMSALAYLPWQQKG
jgi:hypothetical protein